MTMTSTYTPARTFTPSTGAPSPEAFLDGAPVVDAFGYAELRLESIEGANLDRSGGLPRLALETLGRIAWGERDRNGTFVARGDSYTALIRGTYFGGDIMSQLQVLPLPTTDD